MGLGVFQGESCLVLDVVLLSLVSIQLVSPASGEYNENLAAAIGLLVSIQLVSPASGELISRAT